MRHRSNYNRLDRKESHRRALLRNMVTSLLRYERIKTTRAKAQEVRRKAEKMITRAKVDSVHNRRIVARDINDKAVLTKLFTEVGPRFSDRPGGYTRTLKLGQRRGDAADVVVLELVERSSDDEKKPRKAKRAAAESQEAETADEATT